MKGPNLKKIVFRYGSDFTNDMPAIAHAAQQTNLLRLRTLCLGSAASAACSVSPRHFRCGGSPNSRRNSPNLFRALVVVVACSSILRLKQGHRISSLILRRCGCHLVWWSTASLTSGTIMHQQRVPPGQHEKNISSTLHAKSVGLGPG